MANAEPRFFESFNAHTRVWMVYGYTLSPFNLRHAATLEALGNPAWIGGDFSAYDLLAACATCAGADLPHPEEAARRIELMDLRSQADAWDDYIQACCSGPRTKTRNADCAGRVLNSPFELIIVTYLMRELGISEERAWSMPYGLANWYFAAAKEQETGESSIVSEDEWNEMQQALTQDAIEKEKADTERMRKLLGERERRHRRCKTQAARERVEKWLNEELKKFDD